MVIDSHAHVMFAEESQIELMKEAGVDRTILFSSTIHPEMANSIEMFETELNKLYDILNGVKNPVEARVHAIEELAKVVKGNPEKYIGFGSIPFGLSYAENLAWLEKYIIANDFYGIGELAPSTGKVAKLEPLFRASQEVGNLPLWVHTFFPLNFADIKELLSLAKQYASVPTIIGHMGGMHWLDTLKAIRELPNAYLDLSATYTTIAPSFAIKEFPERTFFSSDAPYCSPLTARTIIEQLVKDPHILKQVLGGNISRVLGL